MPVRDSIWQALFCPGMRERKWGRIINVTSVSVKQPVDGLLLSNTVRSRTNRLGKTVSNEAAADGVTVNNVAPQLHMTERQDELAEVRSKATGIIKTGAIEAVGGK
jgi:3-oxoacyl-[acyl-carrier protein] reductase